LQQYCFRDVFAAITELYGRQQDLSDLATDPFNLYVAGGVVVAPVPAVVPIEPDAPVPPEVPVAPVLPVEPVLPVVPIAEVESTLTESVAAAAAAFCLHDAMAIPAQMHMPNINFFIGGFFVSFNYNKISLLFKIFQRRVVGKCWGIEGQANIM